MSLIHPCAANLAWQKLPAISALSDVTEKPHQFKQEDCVMRFWQSVVMKRQVREKPRGVRVDRQSGQF